MQDGRVVGSGGGVGVGQNIASTNNINNMGQ